MRLHLVGLSEKLVKEWRAAFEAFPEVAIEQGDILKVAHTALVSPANSYGHMDGGIDLVYRNFFGRQIERSVQGKIQAVSPPYLPVGKAIVVDTGHATIPYLIVAPTMFLPEPIEATSCRLAMTAALKAASAHGNGLEALFCPGLGTGVGRVPPHEAAKAMAEAYASVAT